MSGQGIRVPLEACSSEARRLVWRGGKLTRDLPQGFLVVVAGVETVMEPLIMPMWVSEFRYQRLPISSV